MPDCEDTFSKQTDALKHAEVGAEMLKSAFRSMGLSQNREPHVGRCCKESQQETNHPDKAPDFVTLPHAVKGLYNVWLLLGASWAFGQTGGSLDAF